jgi:hypothetical protein
MHINRPIRTPVNAYDSADEYTLAAERLLRKRRKKREVNPLPFARATTPDASEVVALQRLAMDLQREQRDLRSRILENRARLDRLAMRINRLSPDAN